jgi:hypothetical protein
MPFPSPFPPFYAAFLRASEADSGLRKESFLEQARHHIAEGRLHASGRRFSIEWTSGALTGVRRMARVISSPDRVDIPPLVMADHRLIFIDGPEVDCQIVGASFVECRVVPRVVEVPGLPAGSLYGCGSGWGDVRGVASDVERLWPATPPSALVAANAGPPPISEHAMRKMLHQADTDKEPGSVFGMRDAQTVLDKTGRSYNRNMMRDIVNELSEWRGPGRPSKAVK